MATTIQVSKDLVKELKAHKFYEKESYEEVIRDLIEDSAELSEETKRELEVSRRQVREGKTKPFERIKKELGL
ncbi:MAG TPA: hypothetical protein VJI67_03360 [archaeon]|nr:hypothetical protein [archaeon]HLD80879.1 hypothetical protein [archaeon]